jgi:hypothetical protein
VARWLDPEIGHFAQADTIVPGAGNPAAWNRYGYVMYNPVKYTDPSGHRNEGVWCMNHPDDPGCRVLERNYDPEAAVAYALTQTEEGYKEDFKENANKEDKLKIDDLSLCTIFVMDSVITGGGWDSGLPEDLMTWTPGTPFNQTVLFLGFMESREDVETYYHNDAVFNAEDFQIGDIVLYDQHVFDSSGQLLDYNHAMIVTDINLLTNTVWINEMSVGEFNPDGRHISATTFPVFRYVIIRINEYK